MRALAGNPTPHNWTVGDQAWDGSANRLLELSRDLISWRPDIIRAVESQGGLEVVAGAQMSLQGYVAMLRGLAATLPGAPPRFCLHTKTKMSRVSMFLKLFPMVCLIKDKNRLNEVLKGAANILLPGYGSKLPTASQT